ncbi:hypothetical protein HanXRQr2_Chr14g0625331 [Helianthus annuus]|uniref:Uncharacterized protein n=1 Tax=Helianthus annuus TaxID=4232 RepID=A0A9K3E7V7_HELAN|nr:hypothetical protein HanXRQr2_Chr14g0625331 [Helianthus annuus]KAJ0484425.1 hypothetical protein HanHA89_Chr14g0543941 [Helianthus annuus]KAJ0654977.1 hypothetical protein HanLR1_Chr14g0513201 [Helianthus annuus]KAJ0658695.1 hypothetical protein HanOQP8_Chr14g0511091 [Helianthus annuus]KAJ0838895.1 hypothetical protein HanPSC8_Chr14g0600141 [Helianthus annuus]
MTQTNDQHVVSANLLIHQNSERTGQQQQDTNRQPDVATNLLIPQSTERAPGPNIRDDHRPISLVNESIDSSCNEDNKSNGKNRA